jgi:hypothetical protein
MRRVGFSYTLPASCHIKCITAAEEAEEEEEEADEEATMAGRFTRQVLKFLMSGFSSKDKIVRYRVLQASAEMMSHLGAIEYVLCLPLSMA